MDAEYKRRLIVDFIWVGLVILVWWWVWAELTKNWRK